MKILVVVEHDNNSLSSLTLSVVKAINTISNSFDLVVIGSNCNEVATQASKITGCDKVILINSPEYEHQLVENTSKVLVKLAQDYECVAISHSTFGKNLLPRVAALLDVMPISDIIEIKDVDTFVRTMHAGNIQATIKSTAAIKLLSIRASLFPKVDLQENFAPIEELDLVIKNDHTKFISMEHPENDRPDLSSADVVVAGGRALKSSDNFSLITEFADLLGGAVGATRAAVDAGYIANEFQIGQTGKVVAPSLYFAIGISGAIQHLAGMIDSKTIVAINTDKDAPIFQIADYGIVGDLFEIIPQLIKNLKT